MLWLWQFHIAIMGLQTMIEFMIQKCRNERNIIQFVSLKRQNEMNGIIHIAKGGDHGMSKLQARNQ
jgi:hypothetical protein